MMAQHHQRQPSRMSQKEEKCCTPHGTSKAEIFRRCQLIAYDGTNRDAIYQLAQMFEMGQGCVQDYRAAARCYIKLAQDFQDETAMYSLGILYMMGDGVPVNPDKAFLLWEKAARKGHEGAESFLRLQKLAMD